MTSNKGSLVDYGHHQNEEEDYNDIPEVPPVQEEGKEPLAYNPVDAASRIADKYSKKKKPSKEQVNVWVTPEVKRKAKNYVEKNKKGALSELVNEFLEVALKNY
ncbi:MAG: hypothetical protein ACQET8_22520 [Bacillota bacterium]